MMIREVLVHWLKLALILGGLVAAHVTLHIYATTSFAQLFAPTYVPLTEAEAQERYPSHVASVQADQKIWIKIDCYRRHPFGGLEYCDEQAEAAVRAAPKPPLSDVHSEHKKAYQNKEVIPLVNIFREYALPGIFGLFYAAIVLSGLWSVVRWLAGLGLGAKLSWIPRALKTLKARHSGRKLRKAVRDFSDLAALHQNGLISDEMFSRKKAEIKAGLKADS
ncbi:hypothetical protein GCM10027034_19090 [Ramlibacter solisilvae]|uniref:SHOCT domain-containing protein n=1 Tax=Ramlibacter tataouinensis TaxID=94132 RepID=A0A127JVN1_9BURK|nr:hypothetical protein [Ramlibacter tataouinensis]AMO23984.1 hypothetical protein UC35_15345 [Ramlibacter tataouinensis]